MQLSVDFLDLIAGVFFSLFGVGLIVFRKAVSNLSVNWNTKLWHFAAKEKEYEIVFLIVGIIFIIMGLFALFGILHFRR
jgi:hypothetical protein